ncbi:pilus assembly protein TadG-related protein [Sphingobium sp. SJ10-10]|uniref:pilus assembly protein TadG-related protein n=1 Tax=Sphingobium sp. SJ10-10 TaxID=3114999 RepID=UPI002E1924DF|nr:pilus assembly protein TadG-related protein [Sphingobium sp. SJ10-10]
MSARRKSLLQSTSGAVAPTVALSLFGLIAAGGIAFDYARMASLDSELQNAADQAALAAATQLDGKANACSRAASAASALIRNDARFANDGNASGLAVTIQNEAACDRTGFIKFYKNKDRSDTGTLTDADANFVEITVNSRTARFALTPIVSVLSSGALSAKAYAGVGSAICKVPPVMICNPDEPTGNSNEDLTFNATRGVGLKLITGNADAPGNFGWLEAAFSNGANGLAAALGYDSIQADCQQTDGVTTKTGMSTSVLDSLNTRFDVYANGSTCPSQYGGTCSPSRNTRKDLVCNSNNGSTCNNSNGFGVSASPYRPDSVAPLPSTGGATDPDIMGYPRDLCHAVQQSAQTCGTVGSGTWDRDAYFRVNYGWTNEAAWTFGTGLGAGATRYEVYNWEVAHPTVVVGTNSRGIGVGQPLSGNNWGFGSPANGVAGITPSSAGIDRRRISVAVLNCRALNLHGKTTGIDPVKWLDVFLVEPAIDRGKGKNVYTDKKEVYVEVIGDTGSGANGASNPQVIQRSVPYLIE